MRYFYILLIFVGFVRSDIPANCTYEEIKGAWIFSESARDFNGETDCSNSPVKVHTKIELLFPNVAIDSLGNRGHWTMIYNQGFEVTVNYRKYFAYSYYEQNGKNVTSFCDQVKPGYSHDVFGHNWSCYSGQKQTSVSSKTVSNSDTFLTMFLKYRNDYDLIEKINNKQNSWIAKAYPQFEKYTLEEIQRMSGSSKLQLPQIAKSNAQSETLYKKVSSLPENFDWRNVSGKNYVSPVRNQGMCGSCYIFSALGMIEARLRVATDNSVKVQLSPQDIVGCSKYSQGCRGGYTYLVGKYGQDYGFVEENCEPYVAHITECKPRNCSKFYVADYKYLGGFYGACNEDLMLLELIKNGPMSVSYYVYPDFRYYKGGIYHHTGLSSNFDPIQKTSHAVLLVGYGVEPTTHEKYWIIQNSWGSYWGEKGYFRIRRDTDECAIGSAAVQATPIP